MAKLTNFYTRVGSAAVLLALFGGFCVMPPWWRVTALLFLMFALWIEVVQVYRQSARRRSLKGRLVLGASLVVSGLAFLGMVALSIEMLLLVYLCGIVMVTDSAAYFGGNWIVGPKLAPRISPNKTWSGFGSGCLAAVILSLCVYMCVPVYPEALNTLSGYTLLGFLGFAFSVSVLSQVGDLLESASKRFFGVKDSGTLIPGHGGLWDRLDGYLFVFVPMGLVLLSAALLGLYGGISGSPCPFCCDDIPVTPRTHQVPSSSFRKG